ncbi:MAG: carbohydrate kinase [Chitinophagaceae bacterium]|nr:carbohydrate kinase [Chitinophagaceae bacterium]
MKKLLCMGEALIDMICTDKGRSLANGENFLKKAGGAPANVAAAVAALGGQVEMSAKVGADPFGQHLLQVMQDMGIGTRFVFADPQHFTTFAFVSLMENGERDFYFNRGADGQLSTDDLAGIPMDEFDMLHFGSATAFLPGPLQHSYRQLLQQGIDAGMFISFDPNYRHLLFAQQQASFIEQSWYFMEHCHFFKLSDEEAMLLTGTATLEAAADELLRRTSSTFAITLGAAGTLLRCGAHTQLVGSIPVKPIDTTGAGDAFVGAVLCQLQQLPAAQRSMIKLAQWEQIVSNANKAGARTCEYMGAMEAFKHLHKSIFD